MLHEALGEILDAVVETLKGANVKGGLLEEVETIVRGDRARPRPSLPGLFVYADVARNEHAHRALHETWALPVIIVATVKNDDDPEEGYREATALAARARSVAITKGRRLGLDFVQDVASTQFEASGPWMREGSLFLSAATIEVRFTILEN